MDLVADAAGALGYARGVEGMPPPQQVFQAAKHAAADAGIHDHPLLDLGFDLQMSFDTGQGIDFQNIGHNSIRAVKREMN